MTDQADDTYEGDPAYHLPPGTPIVTPERMAKGDMKQPTAHDFGPDGHIRHAQALVMNVLNFLHEKGLVDDQNVEDANTFEIWRGLFRVFTGSGIGAPCYSTVARDPNGCGIREYGYVLLLRRMHRRDRALIEHAIDAYPTHLETTSIIPNEDDEYARREICRLNRIHYMRAFRTLTDVMPGIRDDLRRMEERVKDAGENYLWESLNAHIATFGIS